MTSHDRCGSFRRFAPAALVFMGVALLGCATPQDEVSTISSDVTETLAPGADERGIALHMLGARQHGQTTRVLPLRYPDMERETGFEIQRLALELQQEEGAEVVGWKMGGTRIVDPSASPDPIYGYSLASDLFSEDEAIEPSRFVDRSPMVEAEIVIWMREDLPGPDVSREQLLAAIDGVSGGIELVGARVRAEGDVEPSIAHLLADNVAHAGALPGTTRVPVDSIDFDAEEAVISVNGQEAARGNGSAIMGSSGDPLDAVLWLANELPRHGLMLRAGHFVLTGSLYDNPTLTPGDSAEVSFSTLGSIRLSLAPDGGTSP